MGSLDRVQSHRQRFDQRAERGIETVRESDGLALVDPHVLGERTRAPAHTDHVRLHAVRGFAGETRQAVAASDERERGHVAAEPPRRVGVGTGGHDLPTELVAHHEPSGHRRAELQVGAADAARGHLQHELAGSG